MTATEPICANPDCHNPVTHQPPTGRRAIYCSVTCRPSTKRTRQPITIEIDHPHHSTDGRPAERVWTVQLRRGQHTVTIADNVGWPTASALAGQLEQLLHPRQERGAPR